MSPFFFLTAAHQARTAVVPIAQMGKPGTVKFGTCQGHAASGQGTWSERQWLVLGPAEGKRSKKQGCLQTKNYEKAQLRKTRFLITFFLWSVDIFSALAVLGKESK